MSDRITVEELESRYPEPQFRERLFRLINVVSLLTDSIIQKTYRVPLHLHELIKLTEYGEAMYKELRSRSVPYGEARLLCFLEFYHNDLLVDVMETDRNAIIASISKQISDRSLLYP